MVQQLDGTKNEWGWCKQKVSAYHMWDCAIAAKNNHDFPFV
jgi:hypothetical protein